MRNEPIRVRETSALAYKRLVTEGGLPERRRQVYAALWAAGPCTGSELWNFMGREGNGIRGNVRARLTELRDQGLAQEVERRPCRVTGEVALVWDVTTATVARPLPTKRNRTRQLIELVGWAASRLEELGATTLAERARSRLAAITERAGK